MWRIRLIAGRTKNIDYAKRSYRYPNEIFFFSLTWLLRDRVSSSRLEYLWVICYFLSSNKLVRFRSPDTIETKDWEFFKHPSCRWSEVSWHWFGADIVSFLRLTWKSCENDIFLTSSSTCDGREERPTLPWRFVDISTWKFVSNIVNFFFFFNIRDDHGFEESIRCFQETHHPRELTKDRQFWTLDILLTTE